MLSFMRKKVLVADDEEELRDLVKGYLEECNLEVFLASDGEEAVELAQKHKPDLIITDNNMPGLTGYEVLKSLKNSPETKDILILMVVGKNFDQERKMLLKFGATECIQKPYEKQKIIELVKNLLEKQSVSNLKEDNLKQENDKVDFIVGSEEDQQTKDTEKHTENYLSISSEGSRDDKENDKKQVVTENITNEEKLDIDNTNNLGDTTLESNNKIDVEKDVEEESLTQQEKKVFGENLEKQSFLNTQKYEETPKNFLDEKFIQDFEIRINEPRQSLEQEPQKSSNGSFLELDAKNLSLENQEKISEEHSQEVFSKQTQNFVKEEPIFGSEIGEIEETNLESKEAVIPQSTEEEKFFSIKEETSKRNENFEKLREQKETTFEEKKVEKVFPIKEEQIVSTEETQSGVYLVSKLLSTSLLEILYPQKKVKPTLESKAIILVVEDIISKETLSKLNKIMEIIPLMKVVISRDMFNEKKEKIKKLIKNVSKKEIFNLSDALLQFFKK